MTYKYKTFNFQGFMDFLKELHDSYGFSDIRFYLDNPEYFSEDHLTHAGDNWSLDSKNSFIGAWQKVKDEVRKVEFHYWSKNENRQIKMSIDLDKRNITLDENEGISVVEIKDKLKYKIGLNIKKNSINNFFSSVWIFFKKWKLIGIIVLILILLAFGFKLKSIDIGIFSFSKDSETPSKENKVNIENIQNAVIK